VISAAENKKILSTEADATTHSKKSPVVTLPRHAVIKKIFSLS